jgi:hypothetical protein
MRSTAPPVKLSDFLSCLCPALSCRPSLCPTTKDFTGSISFRLLHTESEAKAGESSPFTSRHRRRRPQQQRHASQLLRLPVPRPNLVLLRGSFAQAIGKLPLGIFFSVDAGKSALYRNNVDFANLRKANPSV